MKGRRLYYVKEAARRIVSNLTSHDTFGLVVFNDRATVLLPAGSAADTSVALGAIDSIKPAGGTEMAQGVRAGLQEVLKHHSSQVISHVILLTDGRTYGDEETVLALAALAGQEKIGMTVMGLGDDWNDELLDEVARRATGTAHYIAEPDQAVELFQSQVQELQRTTARDASLLIDPGPDAKLLQVHEVAPGLRRLDVEENVVTIGSLPTAPPLRLMAELSVRKTPRDVVFIADFVLRAQLVQDSKQYETHRTVLADVGDVASEPSMDVYQSAQRVATLRLQQRTWEALENGEELSAIASLEQLADRFLELGAMDLAIATQQEVERFQLTRELSEGGRKIIKYGTRMLALPPPPTSESNSAGHDFPGVL
jgi:Ca-activated chloride channel family protein